MASHMRTAASSGNDLPTSASVLDFICLFSHDLKRKQKRWQDGKLKYHTFNKRVMVYDDRGHFIGDAHWQSEYDLQNGGELTLDRGSAVVEVSECIGSREQDLTELLDKRAKEVEKRRANGSSRTPASSGNNFSVPRSSEHAAASRTSHRPLADVMGTPARIGRAIIPTRSPYEARQIAIKESPQGDEGRQPKRKRQESNSPPSKSHHSRSLFGATLSLSSQPIAKRPLVKRQVLQDRTNQVPPEKEPEAIDSDDAAMETAVDKRMGEPVRERDPLKSNHFKQAPLREDEDIAVIAATTSKDRRGSSKALQRPDAPRAAPNTSKHSSLIGVLSSSPDPAGTTDNSERVVQARPQKRPKGLLTMLPNKQHMSTAEKVGHRELSPFQEPAQEPKAVEEPQTEPYARTRDRPRSATPDNFANKPTLAAGATKMASEPQTRLRIKTKPKRGLLSIGLDHANKPNSSERPIPGPTNSESDAAAEEAEQQEKTANDDEGKRAAGPELAIHDKGKKRLVYAAEHDSQHVSIPVRDSAQETKEPRTALRIKPRQKRGLLCLSKQAQLKSSIAGSAPAKVLEATRTSSSRRSPSFTEEVPPSANYQSHRQSSQSPPPPKLDRATTSKGTILQDVDTEHEEGPPSKRRGTKAKKPIVVVDSSSESDIPTTLRKRAQSRHTEPDSDTEPDASTTKARSKLRKPDPLLELDSASSSDEEDSMAQSLQARGAGRGRPSRTTKTTQRTKNQDSESGPQITKMARKSVKSKEIFGFVPVADEDMIPSHILSAMNMAVSAPTTLHNTIPSVPKPPMPKDHQNEAAIKDVEAEPVAQKERGASLEPRAAESQNSETKTALKIRNPATRGKKAARKEDAAGRLPEVLVPFEAPIPLLARKVTRSCPPPPAPAPAPAHAPRGLAPSEGAGGVTTSVVRRADLPGFSRANGGAWSRHAEDLLGMSRPSNNGVR